MMKFQPMLIMESDKKETWYKKSYRISLQLATTFKCRIMLSFLPSQRQKYVYRLWSNYILLYKEKSLLWTAFLLLKKNFRGLK